MRRIPDDVGNLIAPLIRANDTDEAREAYRAGNFPRSDRVTDLDKRYRWDLFWSIDPEARSLFSNRVYLDLGGSDRHVDTLLRAIVAPL